MSEWIKCSNTLPELKDDSVLVFWPETGAIETVHIEDYFKDITDGVDAEGKQLYTKWYLSNGVTHWMPLPEAPAGWKCFDESGDPDHDWQYVSDWGGDPSVPGGTFDCSFLRCRACGDEDHSHPSPGSYASEPDYDDAPRKIITTMPGGYIA